MGIVTGMLIGYVKIGYEWGYSMNGDMIHNKLYKGDMNGDMMHSQ